jgi:hypothetical protein
MVCRVNAGWQAAPTGHEGSAWNAAGTFEERTYTKWAEVSEG